ncbi:MAG: hypothetical protein ABGW69_02860 [Nanoarchaeota archaeon]
MMVEIVDIDYEPFLKNGRSKQKMILIKLIKIDGIKGYENLMNELPNGLKD